MITHDNNTEPSTTRSETETKEVISPTLVEVASVPVGPNIWELRKQAAAMAAAMKEAEETLRAATAATKAAVAESQTVRSTKVAAPVVTSPESEGFTKVGYKSKGKTYHTGPKTFKTATAVDASAAASASEKPRAPRAPRTSHDKETDEASPQRIAKNKALEQAQEIVVKECTALLTPAVQQEINGSIKYILNYSRALQLRLEDKPDDIVTEVDGQKYAFSRIRFLQNRYFINRVREAYEKLLPDAWLSVFQSKRDENTYIFMIKKYEER